MHIDLSARNREKILALSGKMNMSANSIVNVMLSAVDQEDLCEIVRIAARISPELHGRRLNRRRRRKIVIG